MNSYFQFYSNVLPFKGINRSIIFDTQFKNYYFISNFIFDKIKGNTINVSTLESEEPLVLKKWLDYFFENNLGFYTENTSFYPQINTDFYYEGYISNMIVEISEQNYTLFNEQILISQIESLGVKALLVICEKPKILDFLDFLAVFKVSIIEHIEFFLSINYFNDEFIKNLSKNTRIKRVTFLNSKENDNYKINELSVEFTEKYNVQKLCGNIFLHNNFINLKNITESINHNSCLNKKLSIDKDGNIKNCPSMPQSFGNIKDTTLEEALNHKDFKKYWNVNKDMIAVCKDCEFRHICTDCRAYTERTDFEGDIDLSKPLKCGYNPYTNVWEEWSTNPLKQKAIEYYGMQDLIKKN